MGYEVDPKLLADSGKAVGAQGDALINALDALDSALSGSELMCGTDAPGLEFFLSYSKGGQAVISAAESAVNAFRNVGYGVEVSAHNYAVSDAASTVGGGRESIPVPAEPARYMASGISGQSGPDIPPPPLWSLVQPFISRMWPDGNPATMHAVADAWRAFGSAISTASGDAGDCLASVSGHDIPELVHITDALNTLTSGAGELAGKCNSIAEKLDAFADEVQSSQDAIRDLLDRLSASGILSQIGRVLSGHNPIDDLKQIGHDISEILHTLSRELDGLAAGFQIMIDGMDGLVRSFEEWDRKQFTRFFGDQVGNAMADGVNSYLDIEEGVAKSLLETAGSVPTMLAHPVETAQGIAGLGMDTVEAFGPLQPLINPEGSREAREHLIDVAKGVVDYKDWSGDRPLVGLGDNVGNIAQVLIPGVGEAKAGLTAGKAGQEAAQIARAEGKVVRGGLDALGEAGGKEFVEQAGKIDKDFDGLGAKPVEVPKAPEPGARLGDSGHESAARPIEDGAAGGNAGGGKAPVDAASRPGMDSTPAPHGPAASSHVAEPNGGSPHSSGPMPHNGAEPPTSRDGSGGQAAGAPDGNGSHSPEPVHASAGEATAGGAAPHEAPDPREMPESHRVGSHDGGDQGVGSHGAGGGSGDHGGYGPGSGDHHDPVHSGQPSGDGWERLPDSPLDPHYGEPLQHHWPFGHDPVDPAQMTPQVRDLITDPAAPYGRAPDGHAYTEHEYAERFNKLSEHGDHWVNFPWNDGAEPGTKVAFNDLDQYKNCYGSELDRIGQEGGKYLGVVGENGPASWEERAMHVSSLRDPYHGYTLQQLPEGWKVEVSEIVPGVGQPGGGLQVRILADDGEVVRVEDLIKYGILGRR